MKELQEKYADLILKVCLRIKKNQPLFISANSERSDFVRIVVNKAIELGVKDIYLDIIDVNIKHDLLKKIELDNLKDHKYFNRSIWNEYAKKGAAFVMLASENPGLMADIDSEKQIAAQIYSLETRDEFDNLRRKSMVPWNIAAVPTARWARKLFPNSKKPVDDLWMKIFEICGVTKNNSEEALEQKLNKLTERKDKLNTYKIRKLKYKNSLGTDFEIELPKKVLWQAGREQLANGEEMLPNYPTEEVFTSPTNDSANGIVYASKPLSYNDNLITDFWIKFKDGIAIDCGAKEGLDVLKGIISSTNNSNRLGEIALVEYHSPISQSNMIFYETLFDENASCHLALGKAFPECIENGTNLTEEEIIKNKLNICKNHVDFMIGTKDLEITGITADNKEIKIFENGDFSGLFK